MLALLPILFCLAAAGSLPALSHRNQMLRWRERLVLGMLATGTWAVVGTELLSLAHQLRFWPVLIWWTVPTLAFVVVAVRRLSRDRLVIPRPTCDRTTALLIVAAVSILLVTGFDAVICPTNTWDCWQYHLPRIFYWIQQRSVEHFPAFDRRQLEMPPMAEFLSLHWAILSGGWGWTNMHQWFALLGSAIAASLVARELGAGGRGQALASLLIVTNPAAAAQATSGKNDVVVALWGLALAWIAARMWKEKRWTWEASATAGLALGLLLLTKGTGYLLAAPLCAAIAWAMFRVVGARAVPMGAAICIIAAALNTPHWSRNAREFGSPLGQPQSRGGYPLLNTTFSPAALASGVVRNIVLHTSTPWPEFNAREQAAVESLHDAMGISVSDPRTTLRPDRQPFRLDITMFSDGFNPAPIHLVLVLGLVLIAAVRPQMIRDGPGWAAFAVPFAAFLIFCDVLRWQPWHLRLQIPFVALFAPLVGALLPRVGWAPLKGLVILAAVALTWHDLLWLRARPLLGEGSILRETREERLFQQIPKMREPLEGASQAAAAAHPHAVGLFLRELSVEWPSLLLISRDAGPAVPVVSLNPGFGPKLGPGSVAPDVAVVSAPYPGPIEQLQTGRVFLRRAGFPPFFVYVSGERVRAAMAHDDVPAFCGFQMREGLRPEEGPYPGLPFRVRWAKPPRTTLSFESDGSPALLLMDVRRNERSDQVMTIRLNGESVAKYEFGPSRQFWPVRQQVRPRAGENTLELEYMPEEAGFSGRGSVLFKRLQIVKDDAPQ